MAQDRIRSSKYTGVYVRITTDPRRRHNGKPDKAYEYMYRDADGKQRTITAGWASDGYSEQEASRGRIEALAAVEKEKARRKALEKICKGEIEATTPLSSSRGGAEFSDAPGRLPSTTEPDFSRTQARKNGNVQSIPTVDYIVNSYLDWLEGEGKYSEKEKNRYEVNIKGRIGNSLITDVDFESACNLKRRLLKDASADHAKKCLSLLRASYYFAAQKLRINTGGNPFSERDSGFTMPKPQNKGERWLTPEEADLLLLELGKRSTQCMDMSYIMLHTGARPTEIFSICGADPDKLGGCFWVTGKGGIRQPIMSNQECLDRLLSYNRAPHEYIFQSRTGDKIKQFSDTLKRTAEDIGLCAKTTKMVNGKEITINRTLAQKQELRRKRIWAHVWRHTFATWLAMSGDVTLHQLRDLLRHTSIKQTERYAHYIPALNKERSTLISEILVKGRSKLDTVKTKIESTENLTWLDYEVAMAG